MPGKLQELRRQDAKVSAYCRRRLLEEIAKGKKASAIARASGLSEATLSKILKRSRGAGEGQEVGALSQQRLAQYWHMTVDQIIERALNERPEDPDSDPLLNRAELRRTKLWQQLSDEARERILALDQDYTIVEWIRLAECAAILLPVGSSKKAVSGGSSGPSTGSEPFSPSSFPPPPKVARFDDAAPIAAPTPTPAPANEELKRAARERVMRDLGDERTIADSFVRLCHPGPAVGSA